MLAGRGLQVVPPSGHAKGITAQCWGKVTTRNAVYHHPTACTAAQKDPQDRDSVEMYVATGNDREAENSANMLRVAPPRSQSSASSLAASSANGSSKRIVATDHTRALRAELKVTGAELRSKTAELTEAKQIISARDKEMALLRAALVDRDERLQKDRSNLMQAQLKMQDKDEELQTIYRRLSEACKERSDVRSALIGTQSELAETQAELDAWTHELDTFQQALLSVPEDPSFLNGTSQASPARDEGLPTKQAGRAGTADTESAELDAKTKKMLQQLSELSNLLVRDAKEDDQIFRGSV